MRGLAGGAVSAARRVQSYARYMARLSDEYCIWPEDVLLTKFSFVQLVQRLEMGDLGHAITVQLLLKLLSLFKTG